jgi:hypothetical protein
MYCLLNFSIFIKNVSWFLLPNPLSLNFCLALGLLNSALSFVQIIYYPMSEWLQINKS